MSIEAMKQALEMFDWLERRSMYQDLQMKETHEALRQAIEQAEKPWVKTYAGGKPNYTTPEETFILDRGCYERGCIAYDERDGDGITMKQERVDKTVKREHEPVAWMYEWNGRTNFTTTDQRFVEAANPHFAKSKPLYTAPPNREWVGLTHEERFLNDCRSQEEIEYAIAIEAKLKEKNT